MPCESQRRKQRSSQVPGEAMVTQCSSVAQVSTCILLLPTHRLPTSSRVPPDLLGCSCLKAASFRELSGCPSTSSQERETQRSPRICAMAKGPPRQGRGYDARKASAEGSRKRTSREVEQEGWVQVAVADDLIEGKNKAIIHDNDGYVIVKLGPSMYTIKANCTSCQFPIIDGKVEELENGADATIDCPLCHTKVSLVNGKVIAWCPKDGPLQWFVGTLKERAPTLPAKVYPTRQSNAGRIYVKFIGINELKIT